MIETSKLITDLGYLYGKGIRPYPNPYKLETCNHYAVSLKDITIISDGITMTFEKNKVYNISAYIDSRSNSFGVVNYKYVWKIEFDTDKFVEISQAESNGAMFMYLYNCRLIHQVQSLIDKVKDKQEYIEFCNAVARHMESY